SSPQPNSTRIVRISAGVTRPAGIPEPAMKLAVPAKPVIFPNPKTTKIRASRIRPISLPRSFDPFIVHPRRSARTQASGFARLKVVRAIYGSSTLSCSALARLKSMVAGPLLEAADELDQQPVDLGRTLLLSPMADARQDDFFGEVRHVTRHRFDFFAPKAEDAVAITRDEKRWLAQLGAVKKRRQRPIAINIAIVIESAPKAAPLELGGEEVDIRVGYEARLGRGGWHHVGHLLEVDREFPALLRRWLARRRVQRVQYRSTDVGFKKLLRPGTAEDLLIEYLARIFLLLPGARTDRETRQERHAQQGDGAKQVGPEECGRLRDPCAPVMPHDHDRLGAERVDQSDQIAGELKDVVSLDRRGTVGLPVAAHIRRDRVEPGVGQRADLMPPRVPRLGKAVAQQHAWTRAHLRIVEANAVDVGEAMRDLGHLLFSPQCSMA